LVGKEFGWEKCCRVLSAFVPRVRGRGEVCFQLFRFEIATGACARVHKFLVKASPEKGNALNPWSIVRSLKDGIFAVKLDIDTPAVEMPLVDQLLEDKEIQSRVQEFFFEHHTKIAEMVPSWGNKTQGLLSDTYDMFLRLRKAGVRAHAWP
jgi:hypothetical protein